MKMSRIQILRSIVNERLTAAADEIFGVIERTIVEYEGEIVRQRKLLDNYTLETETKIHERDPAQLSVCEEEVPPEQQERSPSLGQEEPEPLKIKEEQEELWTSQEGEQLQGLEEADITKFTFNPVSVKSEHDEEKPQSSCCKQTQTEPNREAESTTEQMKTESDGEDCGVSEPASNLDTGVDLELSRDGQLLSSDCFGIKTDDSDEWEENGEPQSGLNTLKSKKTQKNKGQSLCISKKFKSSVGSSHEVKLSNCGVLEPASNLDPAVDLEPSRDGQLLSSDCSGIKTDDSDEWEETGEPQSGLNTLKSKKTQKHKGKSLCISKKFKSSVGSSHEVKFSNCGVLEPASKFDPAGDLEPTRDGQLLSSECSGIETDDSDEWEETGEPQSGLNTLKSKETQKHKGQSLSNRNKFKTSMGSSHELTLSNQILSENWSCKVCGKCFPSWNSLVHHIKIHPSDCGLCGKHLEPKERLGLYFETHWTCTVCGMKFTKATDLERHVRSHTGGKPYGCTLCNKIFGHNSNLTKHMRNHTGEKPYRCTLCHKKCVTKQNITRHLRSHTGGKPYSCTLCHKRFGQKQHLDSHMRIHTGEKPCTCTLSQKIFFKEKLEN